LGKIFEDIFQGAYYEAYQLLPEEEKRKLLILALQDTHVGLFTDWCMRQLCKIGCGDAQDVLRRYGSRIDPETFSSQDCVECFSMANEAWAKIAGELISYREISSPDHQVWAIIGELIFWAKRQDDANLRAGFRSSVTNCCVSHRLCQMCSGKLAEAIRG